MLKGFKDFITRGNVVDLAVGVVIGGAFGAVIKQFTDSFLSPGLRRLVPVRWAVLKKAFVVVSRRLTPAPVGVINRLLWQHRGRILFELDVAVIVVTHARNANGFA